MSGRAVRFFAIQINFAEHNLIFLEPAEQYISYILEGSFDGTEYHMIADKSQNKSDVPHDYIELENPLHYRYYRLTNVHTPCGGTFAVRGIRLFGKKVEPPVGTIDYVAERDRRDPRKCRVRWKKDDWADGYVVRYGCTPETMFRSLEIYGLDCTINSLIKGVDYFITVEGFNQGGYERNGKVTKL